MKRFSLLGLMIALSVALCSCGGGGGGDDTGGGNTITYPATTNIFKNYKGGEILTYDYSYSSSYSDGSGAVRSSGKETQDIYSGWSNPEITYPLYKLVVNDQPTSGVSLTVEDFYFYDNSKNLIRYSTNNHYSNQGNHTAGSLLIPSVLSVGYGWSNTTYLKQLNDTDYYGTVSYTIVSKGFISVPMGNVEAYKITYTGDMASGYYTLKYSGEYFVNPSIGIIKTVETGIYKDTQSYPNSPYYYNYSYTSLLTSINWKP